MQQFKPLSSPVLGIALVVEQLGKGADLIFRYPVMSSDSIESPTLGPIKHHSFFSLSPRIMAKLFRTKAPLCNQPMTLLVGETIFCCRSILLSSQAASINSQTSGSTESKDEFNTFSAPSTSADSSCNSKSNNLVLFSIIVGLLADPFSSSNRLQDPRTLIDSSSSNPPQDSLLSSQSLSNVTNPAVRHIHTSLYRLARALEREEKRCLYVSRQVHRIITIRAQTLQSFNGQNQPPSLEPISHNKSLQNVSSEPINAIASIESKRNEDDSISLDVSSHSGSVTISTNASFHSKDQFISSTGTQDRQPILESNYNIPTSHRTSSNLTRSDDSQKGFDSYDKAQERTVQEQAIIENLLSEVTPITSDATLLEEKLHRIPIFGNLARELVQTFYSLSCQGSDFGKSLKQNIIEKSPLNSSAVTDDCIVYINNHIAIAVEPAFTPQLLSSQSPEGNTASSVPSVRSYHTLIFADLSPMDLLQTFQAVDRSSHSTPASFLNLPQHNNSLIKLLQAAGDPFQSLSDLSFSTALPLPTVLDAALTLVRAGVCMLAPTFQRSSTAFVMEGNRQNARLSINPPLSVQTEGCSQDTDGGLTKMRSLSLAFSQRFGPYIPIFLVASVLTTPLSTTGLEYIDSMDRKHDEYEYRNRDLPDQDNVSVASDGSSNERVGKRIPIKLGHVLKFCSAIVVLEHHRKSLGLRSQPPPTFPNSLRLLTQYIRRTLQLEYVPPGFRNMKRISHHNHREDETYEEISAIEGAIISMTTWLYANKIISCLKQYLVPISTLSRRPSCDEETSSSLSQTEKLDTTGELLFKQVKESNYLLSGMISNTALAWKCGWNTSSMQTFQRYVLRQKNFQLVTRGHSEGDDWGSA